MGTVRFDSEVLDAITGSISMYKLLQLGCSAGSCVSVLGKKKPHRYTYLGYDPQEGQYVVSYFLRGSVENSVMRIRPVWDPRISTNIWQKCSNGT